MDTLITIIYKPLRAFRELKSSEKFPFMSLVVLLIVVVITNILMIPVNAKVFELTFSSIQIPLNEAQSKQMENMMQIMHKLRYLIAMGSVFTYLFTLVAYTLIIWILTKIMKQSLSFQKAFELIIHCCFVLAIGDLVSAFILYGQGIENIKSMYEISLTGLNLLTSVEQVGATFYIFLTLINPFQVWFLVLLTVGLAILADLKFSKAFITCFILWVILIAFPVVTIYFSQLFMQKTGLF